MNKKKRLKLIKKLEKNGFMTVANEDYDTLLEQNRVLAIEVENYKTAETKSVYDNLFKTCRISVTGDELQEAHYTYSLTECENALLKDAVRKAKLYDKEHTDVKKKKVE